MLIVGQKKSLTVDVKATIRENIEEDSLNIGNNSDVRTESELINERLLQSARETFSNPSNNHRTKMPRALNTSLLQWRKSRFDFNSGFSLRQCNQNQICWEQELSMAVSRLLDSTFFATSTRRPFTVAPEMVKRRHLNARKAENGSVI